MSYMFAFCSSLKSISNISNWNTENDNKLDGMFEDCRSLKSIEDIAKE